MEYRPAGFDVNDSAQGFVVNAGSLYDFLSRPEDRRDARGIRYSLTRVLVFVPSAKLAGEDWRHLRLGHAQRMMAAVNNLVLGLLLRRGAPSQTLARSAWRGMSTPDANLANQRIIREANAIATHHGCPILG